MKIAIFNSFKFHYEMFGFILDYLYNKNLNYTVYSESLDNFGWFDVYKRRYNNFDVNHIRFFNCYNYDYVFLPTDDDKKYRYGLGKCKVILFEHMSFRFGSQFAYRRIPLRKYNLRNPPTHDDDWLLPIWNILPKQIKDNNKLCITAIGNNCPSNPNELIQYFHPDTLYTSEFIFINRSNAPTQFDMSSWSHYPNVKLYYNIDAEQMLLYAAKSDWLLMLPKNAYQLKESISAIIPISYGVHTPLLMTYEYCKEYNMPGICQLNRQKPQCKPSELELESFETYIKSLFERRNRILDEALSLNA